MKSKITHCAEWLKTLVCLLLLSLLSSSSFAALEPTHGQVKGIMGTLKNYLYDGIVLVSILIGIAPILVVAWHTASGFLEMRRGKKTLADFRATWGIGMVLCMACCGMSVCLFYLVTKML